MAESSLIAILLALIGVCLVVMTVVMSLTAREVRRTLRRVNAMLPGCTQAIRDAHRTMGQVQEVLDRAHHMTRRLDAVVKTACEVTRGIIEPIVEWKERAQTLFTQHGGNGSRSGPRRHS